MCRVLEAAASVLQLGSAEAHNMAALSFDDLLQSWGRSIIRRRFHELSMQVHPDKCSLPHADQARISSRALQQQFLMDCLSYTCSSLELLNVCGMKGQSCLHRALHFRSDL